MATTTKILNKAFCKKQAMKWALAAAAETDPGRKEWMEAQGIEWLWKMTDGRK